LATLQAFNAALHEVRAAVAIDVADNVQRCGQIDANCVAAITFLIAVVVASVVVVVAAVAVVVARAHLTHLGYYARLVN